MTATTERTAKPVAVAAVRPTLRWQSNRHIRAYSLLLAVVLLAVGEVSARAELVSQFVLPAPSAVVRSLYDGIQSGLYWEHFLSKFLGAVFGFAVGATLAITSGIILTGIPILERVLMPFVVAFQTMPKIAIAPLIVLWLGFGQTAKVFIVAIVVFFPILVNTLQGLQIRDRDQADLMNALGASRWQRSRYVRFPGALPFIFAGLHIGIIYSIIGAIVAEFVGSQAGLGYLLLQQRALFNVPGVFALLFLMMIIGLILDRAIIFAERKIVFWSRDVSGVSL